MTSARLNIDFKRSIELAKSFGIKVDEDNITLKELHKLIEPYLERIKEGKLEDENHNRFSDDVFFILSRCNTGLYIQSEAPFIKQYQIEHSSKGPNTESTNFGNSGIASFMLANKAFESLSRTEEKSGFVTTLQFPKSNTKFRKEREDIRDINLVSITSDIVAKPTNIQDRGFINTIDRIDVEKLRAGRAKDGTYNSNEIKDFARQLGAPTSGVKSAIVGRVFDLLQEWRGAGKM